MSKKRPLLSRLTAIHSGWTCWAGTAPAEPPLRRAESRPVRPPHVVLPPESSWKRGPLTGPAGEAGRAGSGPIGYRGEEASAGSAPMERRMSGLRVAGSRSSSSAVCSRV
ncbi:hypothetical protein GCM10027440_23500 [Nocardiopsis coralliicola]